MHHSATLIDNIFFNSIAHHTISGNLIYDLSDHLPNFLVINKFSTLPKNVHIFRRDFSKFNEVIFLSDIQSIKWDKELEGHNDVNKLFETFYNKLLEVVDKHVPLNKISKKLMKQLSKPWITPGIRKSIKIKNKLYKKIYKNKIIIIPWKI